MSSGSLGRRVEHDVRSRAYRAVKGPVAVGELRTVNWAHHGPVLDQGALSSCTGNALVQSLMTNPLWRRGRRLGAGDAVAAYSRATQVDEFEGEFPPVDLGTSGLAVCKAGVERGWLVGYEHCFGVDETLAVLQRQPVLIGTTWWTGMDGLSKAGFATAGGDRRGGHEYVLTGVNMRHGYVTALNSWGPTWGRSGRFRMTFGTLRTLLDDLGDVTVPIPST